MNPEIINEIYTWRDRRSRQLDEVMKNSYANLTNKINELVQEHALSMVMPFSGMDSQIFSQKYLSPAIEQWVTNYVLSEVESSFQELQKIVVLYQKSQSSNNIKNISVEGVSSSVDILGPVTVMIAGIVSGIAATVLAITSFLGFIIAINWPLLIGGLVVGTILFAFGAVQVNEIKAKIGKRFSDLILPKIEEALIGPGPSNPPSLKNQIITEYNKAAESSIKLVSSIEGTQ